MASIIDSFRENLSDNYSLLKFIILAIPVYYSYQIYMQAKGHYEYFYWVTGLTLFFLFGFLIKVVNNVINDKDRVLPALNPFSLAFSAIKGLFAVGPLAFIVYQITNAICSSLSSSGLPMNVTSTIQYILLFLALNAVIASLLLFCERENIIDSYKIKKVSQQAGDLIVSFLFLILQLIILDAITVVLIGYIISILFGPGPILDFYASMAFVFNIGVIGHYLGQINYEVIEYNIEKDKK